MHDVKIQRREIAAQMQLWIVIQRAAKIGRQPLLNRPGENVADSVKIKVQVQRDPVIKPEIFIVDGPVVDQANAKGDNTPIDSPDKKTSALRHHPPELRQISFSEFFELHRGTLVHRQIKGINLIQQRRDIVNNLQLNVGRALRFAKFPAQTFPRAVAQVAEVIIEVSEVKW